MNFKKEKRVLLEAANLATKTFSLHYGKKETVKIKPNKTLVSTADIKVNETIIKIITKTFPNHSILSEETGFDNKKSDFTWIIDPIDGTHNLIHNIPICGISIALKHRNEIVLGILAFPKLEIVAFAEKGRGAFVNGNKVKVSDKKNLDHSFILIEFSYSKRKDKIGFLDRFVNRPIDFRNFGSAIYHLLLVAEGKADGFIIFSTRLWDIAAGFLLVEEAGGKITDLEGNKWKPDQNKFIISNGKLHPKLLKHVA